VIRIPVVTVLFLFGLQSTFCAGYEEIPSGGQPTKYLQILKNAKTFPEIQKFAKSLQKTGVVLLELTYDRDLVRPNFIVKTTAQIDLEEGGTIDGIVFIELATKVPNDTGWLSYKIGSTVTRLRVNVYNTPIEVRN